MPLLDQNGQPRQGVCHPSQKTNVLLQKDQLGEPKPTTFISRTASSDFTFGLPKQHDDESARDVTFSWKEHTPSTNSRGGPNYVAMNKLASMNAKTMPSEQLSFRQSHFVPLRRGHTSSRLGRKPSLPSDNDPSFTYGRASSDRPLEERRLSGYTPSVRSLVQGDFYDDWIKMNQRRAQQFAQKVERPPPKSTRASLGHSVQYNKTKRSQSRLVPTQQEAEKEPFKISRFAKVDSIIKRKGEDTRVHEHGKKKLDQAVDDKLEFIKNSASTPRLNDQDDNISTTALADEGAIGQEQ